MSKRYECQLGKTWVFKVHITCQVESFRFLTKIYILNPLFSAKFVLILSFFIIRGNMCCRLCIEAHTNRLAGVFKLAKRSLHVKSQVKQYIYPPAFCKMMMNNLKRCNINLIIIIFGCNIFWRSIYFYVSVFYKTVCSFL